MGKMEEKKEKMEKKTEKKCEKKMKFQASVCEQMEDKEACAQWADAMQTKCKVNSGCKI